MGKMKMVSPTLASTNVKINALLQLWIQEAQFKENPLSNKSEENSLFMGLHLIHRNSDISKTIKVPLW